MSERDPNCKRDPEASSESISPLTKKKKKLDDDSHGVVVVAVPSPSSAEGGDSVTSAGEDDDDKSSIICLSSESYEIAKTSPTVAAVDLQEEDHQLAETETSTSITSSIRKEVNPAVGEITEMESSTSAQKSPGVSKIPTPGEIEEFLSELEDKDQKRFIEKYNFDIVNDKPLQGRYKWDRF
ncbi:Cyclin-dependent kinase inhibitor 6 [Hirschfeldia incana]|nr:Cyclin-dependent kinase inhibitor 6 [Hirschfeldia incana]